MTKWSGWLLVALGAVHILGMLALNLAYVGSWFSGGLWGVPLADHAGPSGALGAFWVVPGSFAVPLVALGITAISLDRRGARLPGVVGWIVGVWAIVLAIVLVPSPFALALIPACLIVIAARRQVNAENAAPDTADSVI